MRGVCSAVELSEGHGRVVPEAVPEPAAFGEAVEVGVRDVMRRARVVDENVEAAESPHGLIDHGDDLLLLGHVRPMRDCFGSQRLDIASGRQRVLLRARVVHHHARSTRAGETKADRAADTGAAAPVTIATLSVSSMRD